jgi:hypothetical protein
MNRRPSELLLESIADFKLNPPRFLLDGEAGLEPPIDPLACESIRS